MMEFNKDHKEFNNDLNLNNPYSKITCLVLYLYSMELGSPPLYYEINRVCRAMDISQLQYLGPYIKALGLVTLLSEQNRQNDDKIKTGKMIDDGYKFKYNMAGLFILYRGVTMLQNWIDQYLSLVNTSQD